MTEWGGQCQFSCLLPQSAQHPPPPAPGERPLSPSQHPKSHLHLPFLGEPWGGHDPACLPKPGVLCLCGCPPLPATWPSQRLVGSEAGGGLGCANGSPPLLPAILPPCLSHLCPPPPSPSITIPLPGQGENNTDRRPPPPPRGGGGARGRLLSKGSPPNPSCSPRLPLLPRCARMAAGAAEVCVCDGGGEAV